MRTASDEKRPGCTINRIELRWTHAKLEHAHVCSVHTHTMCLISHHTPAHISRLSLKAGIFPFALFNPTSYPCQRKTPRQRSPPPHPTPFILFIRLPRSLHTIAIFALIPSLCCSAVSMTTRAENVTRDDSANGGGGCLGGCIIGVSGAGSLCVHSLGLCMYVGGIGGGGGGGVCMHSCIYSCTHWCTAMSVHPRARVCTIVYESVIIHLFLIKGNCC